MAVGVAAYVEEHILRAKDAVTQEEVFSAANTRLWLFPASRFHFHVYSA
jgi:hypothetical protein